ncbi:MAG TPA: hypothetical protein PKN52_06215 [Trueperaceae bacterium]|jgi:hypothetical protein|nr:hypothetical protein [Trueperaceae bacterium]
MWIRTLDDRVINSQQIESLEVVETYADEVDPQDIEAELVEPEYFEIVAVLASGDEALVHVCEDEQEAFLAYDLLTATLARGTYRDGTRVSEVASLVDLLERERQSHN